MIRRSLNTLDKEIIEFYRTAGRMQGIDDSLATILGTLYLEPGEMSMEELAKKTGYSLASISNKIKMLEPSGIIRRVRKPGTKKIFLYAEKDIMRIMKKTLVMKQESVVKLAKERIPFIIRKYKNKKLTEEQKNKLMIIENYYKGILRFEGIIKEILRKLDENQIKTK